MPLRYTEGRGWGPDDHDQEAALGDYASRVARRLNAAREARGLSLREAARITDGFEVTAPTIRNYELDPSSPTRMRLGVVHALAMALEYDLRALLCLPPYDSRDDEADLELASLEPTCAGACWLLGGDPPRECKRWEIFEHGDGLSLIVIKDPDGPKVGPSDRRYVVRGDASAAYETLARMLVLEEGLVDPNDLRDHAEIAGRLRPRITSWDTRARTERPVPERDDQVPIHRRRTAFERSALAELGPGWSYRESDGERCPHLVVDGDRDVELRGFVPGDENACELSMWFVPDLDDPENAYELGVVTDVPCVHASVSRAIDHLREHAGKSGTYRTEFGSIRPDDSLIG